MTAPHRVLDGLARVYPPDGGPLSGSALLWVHGGGFMHGDLDMPEADAVARAFASSGAIVTSVDYRLVQQGKNRFPAGSDDVLTAWSWLRDHAADVEIDPARVFAGGASAGANLVTGAVLRMLGHAPPTEATAPPTALFLAYPTLLATQPAPDAELRAALDADPEADVFVPAVVHEMYANYLGEDPDGAPISAIPGLACAADLAGFPATIMVNSYADGLRVSGEFFAKALAEAGVEIDVTCEPGTRHGHLNRPGEPAFARTMERVVAWLAKR